MVARLEVELRPLAALAQHGVLGRGVFVWEIWQQRERSVQFSFGGLKLSVKFLCSCRNGLHRCYLLVGRFAAGLGGRDCFVGRVLLGAERLKLRQQ